MQVIAQPDERYEKYCRESDFIREHIFPGGHTRLLLSGV
jgi:cyclopropane fatty-acyl-phospholipid synthase-like methyltransferase